MGKVGLFSVLAMALTASLSPDPPTRVKTHGYALSGTISKVDEGKKTFVVRTAAGKETTLVWTAATKVVGGTLKAGDKVALRYLDKDRKHIATSISIGEVSPTPSVTATPK